jgi:hypothetical protein
MKYKIKGHTKQWVKEKGVKTQTIGHKTLHRTLNIEQHEQH